MVTLALGIGVTTALFSVIDGVLLRPLPWMEPERLAAVYSVEPAWLQQPHRAADWNRAPIGWRDWEGLRRSGAFEHVAAWMPNPVVINITFDSPPEIVDGIYASSNLLTTLGMKPHLGRFFAAVDDTFRTEKEHIVVIAFEVWQRQFGGDPDILYRSVYVSTNPINPSAGRPYRIVGVLPPAIRFLGQTPQVVLPIGFMEYNGSFETNRFLRAFGRLAKDVDVRRALAASEPIVRGKDTTEKRTARVVPLVEEEIGQAAHRLWLLLGGAGLLLVVAYTNVAGLLVGEARKRRHEMAVRASLGGGFGRVLRQLTVEHLLLAAIASAAGVLLAFWLTPMLIAIAPAELPRLDTVRLDWRIAGAALGLGLLTTVLFALMPLVRLARTPAALILAEGGRDGGATRRFGQRLVVASQIAISLVLLVAASLFAETMARLTAKPLGFEPKNLTVATIRSVGRPYNPAPQNRPIVFGEEPARGTSAGRPLNRDEVQRQITDSNTARVAGPLQSLATLAGAGEVAAANYAPFLDVMPGVRVRPDGTPATQDQLVSGVTVTERYFQTLGIDLVRGRLFEWRDAYGVRPAIVSRELERRVFAGNAIGQRLLRSGIGPAYDVVGVVENVKHREFTEDDLAIVYFPFQGFNTLTQFFVRSTGDTSLSTLTNAVRAADPLVVVSASRPMSTLVARTVAEPLFRARLATAFGVIALVLAAVGLYGLAARAVADRRREIGVRVALGARPGDVRRLFLRDAIRTVTIGLVLGVPGAYAVSQLVRAFLYGVSPGAPHIFAIAAAVLVVSAVLATLVPARRAAAMDPMLALKE
jgi:hypothetical protein